jgi:hypothetical protein
MIAESGRFDDQSHRTSGDIASRGFNVRMMDWRGPLIPVEKNSDRPSALFRNGDYRTNVTFGFRRSRFSQPAQPDAISHGEGDRLRDGTVGRMSHDPFYSRLPREPQPLVNMIQLTTFHQGQSFSLLKRRHSSAAHLVSVGQTALSSSERTLP